MQPTLHPILNADNPDRTGDVVFIHGLNGHFRRTWSAAGNDAFWPEWLGEDCPELGVWSLAYAASPSEWRGHTLSLFDRALNILDLLHLHGLGDKPFALSRTAWVG